MEVIRNVYFNIQLIINQCYKYISFNVLNTATSVFMVKTRVQGTFIVTGAPFCEALRLYSGFLPPVSGHSEETGNFPESVRGQKKEATLIYDKSREYKNIMETMHR